MSKNPKSTVIQRGDGQTVLTVPKEIGDDRELAGRPAVWRVLGRDELRLKYGRLDEDEPTLTINRMSNGQYRVSVPTGLARAMRLTGAKLEWQTHTSTSMEAEVVTRGDSA